MVRSIKWNQEDALVARRFKQELAPVCGKYGIGCSGPRQAGHSWKGRARQGCVSRLLNGQIHKLSSPYFPSSNQAHTSS
ncbi:unnamed protein product [Brassica oleracea var. botrytis]